MWVEIDEVNTNFKSLNFTLMEEKLDDKTKTQTGRTNFIPKYEIGEIIAITFKKQFKYLAKVKKLYPKQLKNLNLVEALRDGFYSIKEFQKGLMELNNIKSLNHWCFLTVFKAITIEDYIEIRERGLE